MSSRTRYTVELTPEAEARLAVLAHRLDDTAAGAIRRAISAYADLLTLVDSGQKIVARDADGFERDLLVLT